jgi:hypothetical protein
MPDVKNVHRSERLITPDGAEVDIDVEMVPLIRQLWALGLPTAGCCQDLGESIVIGNSPSRTRHADFYRGLAWLKMPLPAGCELLGYLAERPEYAERLRRWTHPQAWLAQVHLVPGESGTIELGHAQIHFPREQLDEVTAVLKQHVR